MRAFAGVFSVLGVGDVCYRGKFGETSVTLYVCKRINRCRWWSRGEVHC